MLSMLFKDKISDAQDEYLFQKYLGYPVEYDYNIPGIDCKITIYFEDTKIAEEASEELKAKGYKFITHIHRGKPLFHHKFYEIEEQPPPSEATPSPSEVNDRYDFEQESYQSPVANMKSEAGTSQLYSIKSSPAQPSLSSGAMDSQYVTVAQLREAINNQLNACMMGVSSKLDALSTSFSSATSIRNDHDYVAPGPAPLTKPAPTTIAQALMTTSSDFKAKNELLANGIRCEKCNKNIRGVEPISKLIMAVREHVLEHFDNENQLLKRFQCRECPTFLTNFVDDFEKHLKKHGSMVSLTERRKKMCFNLCTETHLKLIAELCDKCFPEVFEKQPAILSAACEIATPVKAKESVFPRLDRLYCSRYHIPYSGIRRSGQPVVHKID